MKKERKLSSIKEMSRKRKQKNLQIMSSNLMRIL